MNLLVTGAAGFIGSNFVLRHREKFPQDTIVVLDSMSIGSNKEFLAPVMGHVTFVQGDIVDGLLVASIVKKHAIDTIINFAAETHVDRSIQNPIPFLHSNMLGVQSLIEVAKAYPKILFFHVSTDEVYGDQSDTDHPRTVEDALRPSSPYAASKASGDLLLLAAIRTFKIRARISRCTNNYGPHQDDEKFIPTIIRHALEDKPIPVYGQGRNRRDWLFVADHCDAIETILAKGTDGKVYHISADDERQNIDVAKAILKVLGKPESLISFVKDRPGHDWRYALDSKETRALGWKPKVSFAEGLKRTVEWYLR